MKMLHAGKGITDKYSHLLAGLIVLFLIAPFLNRLNIKFPVINFMFLVVIVLTLRILKLKRHIFLSIIAMAIAGLSLEFFTNMGVFPNSDNKIVVITILAYGLFMGFALLFLIKNVFSEQCISGDTIKGGVSIYILMGFWWSVAYCAVAVFDPGAFINTLGNCGATDFLFFSFNTLTTVGYGDIVPKSDVANVLASLEAMTGILYVAIFIARLVSLHTLSKTQKN